MEDAKLAPTSLDLFVLEAGAATASQGSGYFTVASRSEAVTASYSSANSSVSVTPLTTGRASLQLLDLCLSSRTEASLQVSVAGVDRVVLVTEDKVQLGNVISALSVPNATHIPYRDNKLTLVRVGERICRLHCVCMCVYQVS